MNNITFTHCRKCGKEINSVGTWQEALCDNSWCLHLHEEQMEREKYVKYV